MHSRIGDREIPVGRMLIRARHCQCVYWPFQLANASVGYTRPTTSRILCTTRWMRTRTCPAARMRIQTQRTSTRTTTRRRRTPTVRPASRMAGVCCVRETKPRTSSTWTRTTWTSSTTTRRWRVSPTMTATGRSARSRWATLLRTRIPTQTCWTRARSVNLQSACTCAAARANMQQAITGNSSRDGLAATARCKMRVRDGGLKTEKGERVRECGMQSWAGALCAMPAG
ncbi:uncharacterized protein V1518DRAFT_34318 [Limtongia smithiae]|uniref:uncharacterized protein n=1 Tax=Limtongia smithiae TaxID=1125753 RepID=UPI0034CDE94F